MASSKNTPSSNFLLSTVAACLARHVRPGQKLVVGLSGGLDSVTLLHMLGPAGVAAGTELAALHVHHGLSANADAWQSFCERLCDRWNIPLTVERVSVDLASGEGIEAAARRARHAAYDRMPADWVVLAHHRGDQAETQLFNLLRGSGVAGAAAMASRQRRLLRPLLDVGRADILAYAKAHDFEWIEDESNQDVRFSRNFLRHEVMRRIAERFPAAEANLSAAARRFAEAVSLLDQLAEADLAGGDRHFPVAVALLDKLSEPRARNVLRYLLDRQGIQIPGEQRLVEACRQIMTAGPDRHPRVAFGDWHLVRRRGQVDIERAVSC